MSKFDFVKLAEKIDIQSIVHNVKTMVNPAGNIPSEESNDPVVGRIQMLEAQVRELASIHAEQAKRLSKVRDGLGLLFEALENTRKTDKADAAAESSPPDTANKSEASTLNADSAMAKNQQPESVAVMEKEELSQGAEASDVAKKVD